MNPNLYMFNVHHNISIKATNKLY